MVFIVCILQLFLHYSIYYSILIHMLFDFSNVPGTCDFVVCRISTRQL